MSKKSPELRVEARRMCLPVRVEVHVAVACMLPQEAQVLFGPGPPQQAEGVLLRGGDDQVHAPDFASLGHKHPKHLVKPERTMRIQLSMSKEKQAFQHNGSLDVEAGQTCEYSKHLCDMH